MQTSSLSVVYIFTHYTVKAKKVQKRNRFERVRLLLKGGLPHPTWKGGNAAISNHYTHDRCYLPLTYTSSLSSVIQHPVSYFATRFSASSFQDQYGVMSVGMEETSTRSGETI